VGDADVIVAAALVPLRHPVGGERVGDVGLLYAAEEVQVGGVGGFLVAAAAQGVVDEDGDLPGPAHRGLQGPVVDGLPGPVQGALGVEGAAAGAGELLPHPPGGPVHRHVPEDDLLAAVGAEEEVGPDGVVDAGPDPVRGVTVGVPGLVHPAALFFHFAEDAAGFPLKGVGVHRGVVVVGDEGGGGAEVNQDGPAGAQAGEGAALLVQDGAVVLDPVAQALDSPAVAAELSGHAGHAGAAEAVQDDVTGVGVVEDVAHDGPMGHFGVVGVGVVDGGVLALGDVGGEGFAVVGGAAGEARRLLGRVVRGEAPLGAELTAFLPPALEDFGEEGVGTGGVGGRVGEGQDGLVGADGEALNGAEGGVAQGLPQPLAVDFPVGRFGRTGLRGGGWGGEVGLVGHGRFLWLYANYGKTRLARFHHSSNSSGVTVEGRNSASRAFS